MRRIILPEEDHQAQDHIYRPPPIVPESYLEYAHRYISPYLASTWVISAAMLNPNILESLGLMSALVPYIFIVSFFPWSFLILSWAVSYIVKYKWHILFKNAVFKLIKWIWNELKAMKRYYWAKFFLGLLILIMVLLLPRWIYNHIDVLTILSTLKELVMLIWYHIFHVDELIVAINNWLNNNVFHYFIDILGSFLYAAQNIVTNNPILGLGVMGGILAITLGIIQIVKCVSSLDP